MTKTTLIIALTLIATFGYALSQTTAPQPTGTHIINNQAESVKPVVTPDSPKLEFIGNITNDTYDWGTVTPKDSPLHTSVVLKNTGKSKLIITEVKPGCGCTNAPLSKDTLAPSDTASLAITLNVGGNSGRITKQIAISSNDPASPKKYLYLAANIIHPIQLSPSQYFTFNNLFINTKDTATLSIKNNTQQDITFSDFVVTPATASVSVTKPFTLKPTEEKQVTAIVLGEKIGSYQMSYSMKTTHPDYQNFSISGVGNVREPDKK
jgi:hypothetical protein